MRAGKPAPSACRLYLFIVFVYIEFSGFYYTSVRQVEAPTEVGIVKNQGRKVNKGWTWHIFTL